MTTTPAPVTSAPRSPALDRLFAALRRSPLVRSQDRAIAGVCKALADRLGVAPAVVRIVAVVAALLGPAVVLYLVAWLLLPDAEGGIRLEKALRGGDRASIALLVLGVLAVLPDAGAHSHIGWFMPVFVVGVVAFYLWGKSSHHGHGARQGQEGHGSWSPDATATGPQDTPHT